MLLPIKPKELMTDFKRLESDERTVEPCRNLFKTSVKGAVFMLSLSESTLD